MLILLLAALSLQMPVPASGAPASEGTKRPRQDEPAEKPRLEAPAGVKKEGDAELRVTVGASMTYDTNILKLDDRDVRRLEEGSRPDRFRIEEPDDFIFAPWAEAAVRTAFLDETFTAGVRGQMFQYVTNTIANYERIGAFVRWYEMDLEYRFTPERYRREYRDRATDTFQSAFYSEHEIEASGRVRPVEVVSIRPHVTLEIRDYESVFDYRDFLRWRLGARAGVDVSETFEVFLTYEYTIRDAYEATGQPDISYRGHSFEPGAALEIATGLELSLRYRIETREYTTDNPPGVDPGHRDRTDDRGRLLFRTAWKPTKKLEVEGAYERSWSDSDLVADPGATDEETTWDRNEYTLAFNYRF